MNIYEEQKYDHTIDQIIIQLENLIMDIMLTSIKRVQNNYDHLIVKTTQKKVDDIPF
jgi:hypothetical protein